MTKKPIEIDGSSAFYRDLQSNNSGLNRGIWNLMLSIRDLKLYAKGIKPHRNWKISDLKKYFGINGNAKALLYKLETINKVIRGEYNG